MNCLAEKEKFLCVPAGQHERLGEPFPVLLLSGLSVSVVEAVCVQALRHRRAAYTLPLLTSAFSYQVVIEKGGACGAGATTCCIQADTDCRIRVTTEANVRQP